MPIWVSRVRPSKAQGTSADVSARSAAAVAAMPRPRADTSVIAWMCKGFMSGGPAGGGTDYHGAEQRQGDADADSQADALEDRRGGEDHEEEGEDGGGGADYQRLRHLPLVVIAGAVVAHKERVVQTDAGDQQQRGDMERRQRRSQQRQDCHGQQQ